jgi:predicted PurR-regulated permease PerM
MKPKIDTNLSTSPSSIVWTLLAGGGLVLIIGSMRAASQIVNMLLLAYVITLMFTPLFIWLRKKRISSFIAILVILLTLFLFALILVWFVTISVNQFGAQLPEYEAQLASALGNLIPLEALPLAADTIFEIQLEEFVSLDSLANSALKVIPSVFSSLSSFTSQALMIAFIVFFGLLESNGLAKRIAKGLESDILLLSELRDINLGVRKYLLICSFAKNGD